MKDILCEHAPAALLDNPVKSACESGWQNWVQTCGTAQALPAFIGHFATLSGHDKRAGGDLAALIAKRNAPVLLLQRDQIDLPAQVVCLEEYSAVQMVLRTPPAVPALDAISPLETRDAEDMLRLAQRCKPGPFAIGTPLLGQFLGIRENGRLVAMVGQRMTLPGWVEVSAICVDPDFEGQGLGARLTCAMVHLILAGAQMPFLHTYKTNRRAISLYERLGFELRTDMNMASVGLKKDRVQ